MSDLPSVWVQLNDLTGEIHTAKDLFDRDWLDDAMLDHSIHEYTPAAKLAALQKEFAEIDGALEIVARERDEVKAELAACKRDLAHAGQGAKLLIAVSKELRSECERLRNALRECESDLLKLQVVVEQSVRSLRVSWAERSHVVADALEAALTQEPSQ